MPLVPLDKSKETLDQVEKNKTDSLVVGTQSFEIVDETQKKTRKKLPFKKIEKNSENQNQKNRYNKTNDTVLQMEFDENSVSQARLFLRQAQVPEACLKEAEINADFAVDLANSLREEKNNNYDQMLNLIDHSTTSLKNEKKNIREPGFLTKKIVSNMSPWFIRTMNGQEAIPDLKTIETKIVAQSDEIKKKFLETLFVAIDSQNKRSLSSMELSKEQLNDYLNPLVNYVMTGEKTTGIVQNTTDQITQQINHIMMLVQDNSPKNGMVTFQPGSSNRVFSDARSFEIPSSWYFESNSWLKRIQNIFKAVYEWLKLNSTFHLKHFIFRLVSHAISAFTRDLIGYWLARAAVVSFDTVGNSTLFTGVASLVEGWSITFICLMTIWIIIAVSATTFLVFRLLYKLRHKELQINNLVGALAVLGYVGLMAVVLTSIFVFIAKVALTAVIAAVANIVYLLVRNLTEVLFKYGLEKKPTIAGAGKATVSAVGIRSIQGIFSYKNSGVDYLTGDNNDNGLINNEVLGPVLRSLMNAAQAFIQDKVENHVLKNDPNKQSEMGFNKHDKTRKAVDFLESMSAQTAIYGGWFMISELLKTFFKNLGNVWGTLVQTLFYALYFGVNTFFNAMRTRIPKETNQIQTHDYRSDPELFFV